MIKFILSLLFLIPLCSVGGNFWLVQVVFLFLTFFFILNFTFDFMFTHISYFLGCDLLSYCLVLLRFWICLLIILARHKILKLGNYSDLFIFTILCLIIRLYLTFSSLNFFVFYLFFEIRLIPTLILIVGWGYQPERIEAGVYLLFYTLLVSLPIIISIFYYYGIYNTLDFYLIDYGINNFFVYLCINMVFFVKIPIFFVHLWLPKAHVEAPVSGSIILAGIILKLGGYGLLRVMKLFILIGSRVNIIFVTISLVGGFFVSLICIRQRDLKSLIAYSSVAHMGLVLAGIITLNSWGFWGALVIIVAHGLCSSGLFCLANIAYERLGSRSLYLNKGFLNIIPGLSLWWFLLCSSNIAAPPSLNLLGEILLINSLVRFSWLRMVFLSLVSFFRAVYSLFLYSFSQHGNFYSGTFSFYQGIYCEYLLLFLHWVPLNILLLKGEYLSVWI